MRNFDNKKTYELPDRNIISVGAGRCVEVLFQPSFIGKAASGFLDTPFLNVMKCYVYIRKELYATVVVSCGTDMFRGIVEHDQGNDGVGSIYP